MNKITLERVHFFRTSRVILHKGPINVITATCMVFAIYFVYDFWIDLIYDDRINVIQAITAFLFLFGGSTYSLLKREFDRESKVLSKKQEYFWYNSWVESFVHPYIESLPLERMNDIVSVEYDSFVFFEGKVRDDKTPVKITNSRGEEKLTWAEIVFDENIDTPYFEYRELKEDIPYDTRWQSLVTNTFITDCFLAGLYHAKIYTNDPLMMPDALKETYDKKNAEKWAELEARSYET